jgi:hypothetical protein
MKLFGDKVNDVDMSELMAQSEFRIDDPSKVIQTILDNAYKDPITATVREICQNASEVDPNFTVHLPTLLEPWLGIIDQGTGLSKPDLIKYASGIGASTKDKDNTKVGGFGIGMKVPFTMSDQYLIIDRFNNAEYTFSAYKDEYGVAQFVQMSEQYTGEPNGIEVRVPVEESDFHKVKEKLIKALTYFNPKPQTNTEVEWEDVKYTQSGTYWGLVKRDSYSENSRLIMGNLWYAIDMDKIRESRWDVYNNLLQHGIDLTLPIGAVALPLSREGILYNDTTIKLIREKLDGVISEVLSTFQIEIDKQPNIYSAMQMFKDSEGLIKSLKHNTSDTTYKGIELNKVVHIPSVMSKYAVVPKARWRYKSLALQDYIESKDMDGELKVGMMPDERVVFLIHESTKKVPSRLLKYMEVHHTDKAAVLFYYNDKNKSAVRRWVYTTFGWKVTNDFGDIVPDYKVQRTTTSGVSRKTAKVLELNPRGGGWRSDEWWVDKKDEIDLDNSTGVWVDVRSRTMTSTKYVRYADKLKGVLAILKRYSIIPEDTPVYGCPGSHKNKLKDHPNFMHIDDVIDHLLELRDEVLTPLKIAKMGYVRSIKNFMREQGDLFQLDIDVERSYYNTYKQRVVTFDRDVNAQNAYGIYQACLELAEIHVIESTEGFTAKTQEINNKFFKRYPLLNIVDTYKIQRGKGKEMVEEYIKLKEFCNV